MYIQIVIEEADAGSRVSWLDSESSQMILAQ